MQLISGGKRTFKINFRQKTVRMEADRYPAGGVKHELSGQFFVDITEGIE